MKLLGDLRSILSAPLPPSLTLWDAICLLLVGEDEDELIQGYIPYIENHFRKNGMWEERRDWSGDLSGSPLVYFANHIEVASRYDKADLHSYLPKQVDYLVVYGHNVPTQFDDTFFENVSCKCVIWRDSEYTPPRCLKTDVLMFPCHTVFGMGYSEKRNNTIFECLTREYYEHPPKVFFVEPSYLATSRDLSRSTRKILDGLWARQDVVAARTLTDWRKGGVPSKPAAYSWDWESKRQMDRSDIGENMFEFSDNFNSELGMDMAVKFYAWCRNQMF